MRLEVMTYTFQCDGCGSKQSDFDDACGWNDEDFAWDICHNEAWIEKDGNHYCWKCYDIDDEDNITIKNPTPPRQL